MIISGLITGIYVALIIIEREVFFMLWIPRAAVVPKMVASTDAATATIAVLRREVKIASLWNSFTYQSKVNPVQFALDFETLNEKTISTSIGRYKNVYIA